MSCVNHENAIVGVLWYVVLFWILYWCELVACCCGVPALRLHLIVRRNCGAVWWILCLFACCVLHLVVCCVLRLLLRTCVVAYLRCVCVALRQGLRPNHENSFTCAKKPTQTPSRESGCYYFNYSKYRNTSNLHASPMNAFTAAPIFDKLQNRIECLETWGMCNLRWGGWICEPNYIVQAQNYLLAQQKVVC